MIILLLIIIEIDIILNIFLGVTLSYLGRKDDAIINYSKKISRSIPNMQMLLKIEVKLA